MKETKTTVTTDRATLGDVLAMKLGEMAAEAEKETDSVEETPMDEAKIEEVPVEEAKAEETKAEEVKQD